RTCRTDGNLIRPVAQDRGPLGCGSEGIAVECDADAQQTTGALGPFAHNEESYCPRRAAELPARNRPEVGDGIEQPERLLAGHLGHQDRRAAHAERGDDVQRQRGAGSSGHEIGEGTRVRGPYSGERRRSDEGARRGRGIGDTLLEGTRTECETHIAERRRDGTLTTSAVPPFERAAAAGHAPGVDGSAGYEGFGDGTERPGAGGGG